MMDSASQTPLVGDRLLTIAEVSEHLRVSRSWVTDHANGRRRPYLPSVKLGKLRRFERAVVESFLKECSEFLSARKAA